MYKNQQTYSRLAAVHELSKAVVGWQSELADDLVSLPRLQQQPTHGVAGTLAGDHHFHGRTGFNHLREIKMTLFIFS